MAVKLWQRFEATVGGVTYTGGSSGSIAFVYERSRALLGAAVTSWALTIDLRECGFIPSRMEPLSEELGMSERAESCNHDIWDAFQAWLDLPTYDIMQDNTAFRVGLPDGVTESRPTWKEDNESGGAYLFFEAEEDAKLCCRALACFLVEVLNGTAVRTRG